MNDKILPLLNDIIELEKKREVEWKEAWIKLHKGAKTIGKSSILFHLETLRELIKKEKTETVQ